MLTPSFRCLVRNWCMVAVWLGVIRVESTDMASAHNTSFVLYKVLSVVAPHVRHESVELLNEVLRKSGHFLGYGILGALVFLALRNTNRDRLRPLLSRPWGIYLRDWWRGEWVMIGILFTIAAAAYDEIHQTFIPSRKGRWQDVVIDTCGAALVQAGIYFLSKRAMKRRLELQPEPELASSRP